MRIRAAIVLSVLFPITPSSAAGLRVVADASHRWELAWDSVTLHDAVTSAPLRTFRLPGATQTNARGICPPDIVLTRAGIAYVTSNAEPVIWRLEPGAAHAERIELETGRERMRDFGFAALSLASHGQVLRARAATDGAAWELDPVARTARRLGPARAGPEDCSPG